MNKLKFFLLTLLLISIAYVKVDAKTFYEGEYIDGIYTRTVFKDGSTKYQKARFFRRTNDNKEAYCLQPSQEFNENANYKVDVSGQISGAKWDKITKIAAFGYGYGNHTDPKWYAITQFMIWQIAEDENKYYFTDTLNGNNVIKYTDEINEINNLVNRYEKTPNINYQNNTINSLINKEITIEDINNVINDYKIVNSQGNIVEINDNKIHIKNIQKGFTQIRFEKKLPSDDVVQYYTNYNGQDLMTRGFTGFMPFWISLNGYENHINIKKIDFDTKKYLPSGDAKLIGSVFGLYNNDNELLNKIEINSETTTINNLELGKYYLKELKSGIGYTLNNDKIEFDVTLDSNNIDLLVANKVIEKEVVIHKLFGSKDNLKPEADISFDIYNANNELISTITTDINGDAKILLPYGIYTFKQKNTTTNYTKADDFIVNVNDDDNNDYNYTLYDYKVEFEIPDTGIKESNSYIILLPIILILIMLKKKYAN